MYSETPTHIRPVTPRTYHYDHVYIRLRVLICFCSLSNVFVLNTHSYAYVAFLITTPFSTLYSSSCLLRDTTLDPFSRTWRA